MSGNPSCPGQQTDRDLRLQSALLGLHLAQPVAPVRFEVQRELAAEEEAGGADPDVRGAGRRQPVPRRSSWA